MTAFWKKDKEIKGREVEKKSAGLVKGEKKSAKPKKTSKKASKKDKGLIIPEEKANLINKTLIKPMISEAVMNAQELGKYTFQVRKSATKNDITLAIEALYKVSVEKVNVMNYKPEAKFFRGKKGRTKSYKKAIVTLVNGDKIRLFS